jgi:site-specific recombinase XerD
MSTLAPTLQAFFTDRLARQRQASPHTIAAYRDTVKLLLVFAEQRTGKSPSAMDITDLDAPLIGAFLNHLETDRGNSVRTRNARLAAIHSLFRYCALHHPQDAAVIARVLAIPPKRFDRAVITYLTEEEITALLAAPDRSTWTGRRDHALLLLACQTGLRATELTGLTVGDVHLGSGRHVSCLGKGRKRRITPLTAATGTVLHAWLAERAGLPNDPLFVTRRGTPLSRDALQRRVARYAAIAAASCPTLAGEESFAPRLASLRGHEVAQRRYRRLRDRAMDGPREHRNLPDLHPRRPGAQGTGTGPHRATRRPTRPLPTPGRRPGLPRRTVIMPNTQRRQRSPPRAHPNRSA